MSGTDKQKRTQADATPAAADRPPARSFHARGAGEQFKQANREEPGRGGRAKRKIIFRIYIGTWDATCLLPSTIAIGISRQASNPRACIERKMIRGR